MAFRCGPKTLNRHGQVALFYAMADERDPLSHQQDGVNGFWSIVSMMSNGESTQFPQKHLKKLGRIGLIFVPQTSLTCRAASSLVEPVILPMVHLFS